MTSPDWQAVITALDKQGFAILPLMDAATCKQLWQLYDEEKPFRSRVVMARHGYGQGEYKYLSYPLPQPIADWRETLYRHLAPLANHWHERMGLETRFPATLKLFLERCHAAGQTKPTPLLLSYGAGDYNCLHQDLYGEHVFPLQATIMLSPPEDYTGGAFVLTEQRPRMQSRAEVVTLKLGEAVIFPVRHRPVEGTHGPYRVAMRHGVATVTTGRRRTAGIILHDAT
ncbi:MAG TPA: 2OG-Fe(II) oxygenase [Stellaceae bacterium]|nr:2OG-Fe(II) oxygenase [Stellaceae bacterium]